MKSIRSYAKRRRRQVVRNRISVSFRKKLIVNSTKSEDIFLLLLREVKKLYYPKLSISFQKRWTAAYEMYISDFYFKDYHCTIEIDGGYHISKEQRSKDLQKEGFLYLKGIRTLRIVNEQVAKFTVDSLKEFLERNLILS